MRRTRRVRLPPCRNPTDRSVPVHLTAVLVTSGLLLTACSGGPVGSALGPVDSPTTAQAYVPPAPATAPTAAAEGFPAIEALVQQRYAEYQAVVAQVGATSDPNDPRLASYATGDQLAGLREEFSENLRYGRWTFGQAVPHVSDVRVAAGTATVRDCLDTSTTGTRDHRGRVLATGTPQLPTTTVLVTEGGLWKVAQVSSGETPGGC
jgi:hypothetical protein